MTNLLIILMLQIWMTRSDTFPNVSYAVHIVLPEVDGDSDQRI